MPCLRGDHRAGILAPGQRHAAHPRIGDYARDLVLGDAHVGVGLIWNSRPRQQVGESLRALQYVGRVFHHHGIARYQVRRDEASQMVVRKVPGFDAEQHAERSVQDRRFSRVRMDVLWLEKALAGLSVEVEDVDTELYLGAALFG